MMDALFNVSKKGPPSQVRMRPVQSSHGPSSAASQTNDIVAPKTPSSAFAEISFPTPPEPIPQVRDDIPEEAAGTPPTEAIAPIEDISLSSSPPRPVRSAFQERVRQFQEAIEQPVIDMNKIRELAFQGVPDAPNLRSVYWRILLGLLPRKRDDWPAALEQHRSRYEQFKKELITDPHAENVSAADHPLSLHENSKWNAFFQDQDVMVQIDKDVRRTHPDLQMFSMPESGQLTPHHDALMRVLFIYAKLNPGIKYVQGMNELLAPIYYIFANDTSPEFKGHEEADVFFCFTHLMGEVRDNFCQSLDKTTEGITATLNKLTSLLQRKDRILSRYMHERLGIQPQFYALRWVTLLLSQEFDLPDTLRIWDSLFADPRRFEFLLYFCCAMIICQRDQILANDFAENVKLLQHYPPMDYYQIFRVALQLRESDGYNGP